MLDALAKWVLANPTAAVSMALTVLLPIAVWLVSKQKWFAVSEADIRRWLATVSGAVLAGVATEWLQPPFELGKAWLVTFAALGGATTLFRLVKWLIAHLKPKET